MSWTTYRNRHSREDFHRGDVEAVLYQLSSALGVTLPAGATVEDVIEELDDRLVRLETLSIQVKSFEVNAWIRLFFNLDAILRSTTTASLLADAIVRKAQEGSATANAIIFAAQSANFTLDAELSLIPVFGFHANAVVQGTQSASLLADAIVRKTQSAALTSDAVLRAVQAATFSADAYFFAPGQASFTVDSIKQKTQFFGDTVTHDATATTATDYGDNRTWTHTPGANAKAIIVLLGSWDHTADVTAVTYGNKPLIQRREYSGPDRMEIWSLENLSGRDDNVVRVTGIRQTGGSITLASQAPLKFVTTQQTNYANHDGQIILHTFSVPTVSGFVIGMAGFNQNNWNVALNNLSGQTEHWARGGSQEGFKVYSDTDNTVGVQIGVGWFQGSALMSIQHETTASQGFTINAWKKKTQTASFTANAAISILQTGSFTMDADLQHGFTIDAYIFSDEQESSTLGDMTLGDSTLGG